VRSLLTGGIIALASSSPAAILYLEEFIGGANGWGDRDAGEMGVAHDAGNEWMTGSFGATFLPQTDAFRIDTVSDVGGNFTGDYSGNDLTQIRFELFAVNVLPSDLFIRIIDGANIFSYQFNPINVGSWQPYTVDLVWSAGWIGVSEAAFNAALASVDAVEIQITRNTSVAQNYLLDNVQTLDTEIGDPGGPAAVPEPGVLSLVMMGGMILLMSRTRLLRLKPAV
jgi:hypothetical protein